MVAFQRGDPRRIVAAIFKALERIHQLLRDRSAPENADNAAHTDQYLQIVEKLSKRRPHLLTRIADRPILNNYCGLPHLIVSHLPLSSPLFPHKSLIYLS